MLDEPLNPAEARSLIRKIVSEGTVRFSKHAFDELEKDGLDASDAMRVLQGGWVSPGEFENGSWRYQIRTPTITVVIAFRSEIFAVVVTAWRNR